MKDKLTPIRLGLRVNLPQFVLFSMLTLWIGWFLGMERVIVPLLGSTFYHVSSFIVIMSFIATFGFTKAVLNTVAGRWSDRIGRKRVLVLGWLLGIPIPFMLIYAPSWGWVVLANVLMGFNQALTWTMTVTSKVDIVGPRNRGLALGINEFSGYFGQASGILITGFLASSFGLRPVPFYFGLATVILGLVFSVSFAKETVGYTRLEEAGSRKDLPASGGSEGIGHQPRSFYAIFSLTSWRNKTLLSCSQAGLVEKFTDTLLWGGFPLLLITRGIDIVTIGLIVGSYQIVWGFSQLFTGALSDRIGRKLPISIGMWIMSSGLLIAAVANSIISLYAASVITGFGMALVYPVLLASVSDVALPSERGTSLGVYRFWRDSGYGFGAILIGFVADAAGMVSAFYLCASALFVSGLIAVVLMKETVQK